MTGFKTISLAGVLITAAISAAAVPPDAQIAEAAAQQDMATVRALLKKGANVNATRGDHTTALLWAAHWNDLAVADLLLHAGANVNAASDLGVTALDQAAENVGLEMTDKLLKAGADPNIADVGGRTPLMIAAHTGSVQIVNALLAHGADVQAATKETRYTALMWAISDQFPEIVKALIEAHADVHASAANGFTAMLFAAENGDIQMAKTLMAAGVKVDETGSDGTHPLALSVLRGQGEFALFLLDQGANPNGGLSGIRALHAAAGPVDNWLTEWSEEHPAGRRGRLNPAMRLRVVKALLAHGADPNVRITTSGLMMTYIGYPRKGAFETFSCGTGDMKGATPLWVASNATSGNQLQLMEVTMTMMNTDGYPEIIKALLDGGADLKIPTVDGTTPLMAAAGLGGATFIPGLQRGYRTKGAEGGVKVLVEAGADVNARNEADFTALHGATMRGLDEVIEYLVAHGADINARDFRGRTPYRIAEGAKQSFQFQAYPETAELLKKLGANTRLGIPGTIQERAPKELVASGN